MDYYGFKPGDKVKINSMCIHNREIGTVINWDATMKEIWRLYVSGVELGFRGKTMKYSCILPTLRRNLVPVFISSFPETFYWWFAPHQLKKIEEYEKAKDKKTLGDENR